MSRARAPDRGAAGGGRIFGPGDLRFILLALVARKPTHGYELIKAIEQKFGGGYSPSPGSVYPTLSLLRNLGHVREATSEGARRLFEITDEGRAFLAENQTIIDGIMARVALAARAMSGSTPPAQIHQAMHTLRAALLFHRGEWTEGEANRVREILELAAEAISDRV
jgi:DNA-binding PadR family transcriptional regulator